MSIEAIQQNANAILESIENYEDLLARNRQSKAERIKEYIFKLTAKMHKLIEEDRKNVKA